MFIKIYTDNLVHLNGFKINHFNITQNKIRNILNIDFINSEQARNFKHCINFCNIYNKGCNLVISSSNSKEQILLHDVKTVKNQIPFINSMVLNTTRYSLINSEITSEQLFNELKDLINGDYKSSKLKLIIDKILEE